MINLDSNTFQTGVGLTTPVYPLAGSGNYEVLDTFRVTLPRNSQILIVGLVGASALTGFKLQVKAKQGGRVIDELVDGDFNTDTQRCPEASSALSTTGAAGVFKFALNLSGVCEFVLLGKSAAPSSVVFDVSN